MRSVKQPAADLTSQDSGNGVRPATIRDRLHAFRDSLIASPRIQRLVKTFPLTRPIARRKARQLFDILAGFVYSQILFALVKLKVFDHLAEAPMRLEQLALKVGLPEAEARRLVEAAVALELLEWRSANRIGLGELGAALQANAGIKAMVEHHAMLYGDLADPVSLMRGERSSTSLNQYWSYATSDDPAALPSERVDDYSDLMSASQNMIAGEVLDAYPLARHKRLLDVGGGLGTFCIAAAERAPNLRVELFDLPSVAERAQSRFAERGLADRAEAHGGDFYRDTLPQGADVVSLVRVMYDHGDEGALKILAAARKALAPGGTLLIAEPMAEAPGAETVGAAYFGFYLLAMGSGRARRPDEFFAMLRQSGFSKMKLLSTDMPLQTGLILARV